MIVVAGLVVAAVIFATILRLLMRRQLREKYAVLWFAVGFVVLVISAFPGLFVGLTRLLGVQIPANLLFALTLLLLLGVSLHLSWELSRAEERIRRMVEEHVLLRRRVEALEQAEGSGRREGTPQPASRTEPAEAAEDAGKTQ